MAPAARSALPKAGLVLPGQSLGGSRLGARPAEIQSRWGARHGTCRDCRAPTWYFNYRPFEPQGAGVTFRHGRAVALFTLWSPPDWHTSQGLKIGDPPVRVAALYDATLRVTCTNYYALTIPSRGSTTAIYIFDNQVWGFALLARGQRVCR